MLALGKRFKEFRTQPKKKLYAIMPQLIGLRIALARHDRELTNPLTDPLAEIVNFFNLVSWWHDRGLTDVIAALEEVNRGQYDRIIADLRLLQGQFGNAGRNPSGMNRTERGEAVTPQSVFLGGVYGLFTHPVPFWQARKNEKKGAHPDFPTKNAYDILAAHARRFMESHIEPMCQIIARLEAAT